MSLSALCSNENNEVSQNNKNGISLEDYYKIFAVLTHIDDVDKVSNYYVTIFVSHQTRIIKAKSILKHNVYYRLYVSIISPVPQLILLL